MHTETLVVGPLATNCYVVSSGAGKGSAGRDGGVNHGAGGEGIIIDPGANAGRIADYIDRAGIEPVLIVLTHGHSDHMAAAADLAARYGTGVAMHAADLETLEMSIADAPLWGLGNPERVRITRKLSAGDTIVFGGLSGKVLHTPGHTRGGISILFDGVVFVGDTLFAGSIGRTDFFGGDMETLLTSIRRRLFTLPDDTIVYTGHGPPTTIGDEKRLNPYFDGSG